MSLLLLNSYGKDDEDEHAVESIEENETTTSTSSTTVTSTLTTTTTTATTTSSTTTTTTNAFSIVDYEHDDEDDTEQPQENTGRAIININTPPPVDSPPPISQLPPPSAQVATPPPSSPPADSSHSTPIPTSPLLPSTPPPSTPTSTTTSAIASAAVAPFSAATSSLYLPPEPNKPVADELQAKVVKFLQLKSEGKSLNDQIRSNKQTRNPDILDKLVEHFGIKEIDSNYPKAIFDPFAFSPSDFYDHIAAEQRRMEEKKPEIRTTATAPTASKATGDDKKKGSKWDNMEPKQQGVVTVVTGNAPSVAGTTATTTNPYADYIQKKKREGLEAANNNKRPKK